MNVDNIKLASLKKLPNNEINWDEIEATLRANPGLEQLHPDLKTSAVLLLMIPSEGGFEILITSRSPKLRHHTGEMSFPGGRIDEHLDRTLLDTALRETKEEIGIDPENIRILGKLDDLPTMTGYIIRPFIGVMKDPSQPIIPNPDEVAEVITVPYSFFMNREKFDEMALNRKDIHFRVLSFEYIYPQNQKKYFIWGATAHILAHFFEKVFQKQLSDPSYKRPTVDRVVQALRQYRENEQSQEKNDSKKV